MFCVALIEGVFPERALALDDSQAISGEGEDVALLLADTAVAFVGQLDLGYFELIDEGTAMAVASIGLQGFHLGHVVSGKIQDEGIRV
jgi:hypothetical protein